MIAHAALLLVVAAPQPTARINVAAKACLPLLESQAAQMKSAYDDGLDSMKAAEKVLRDSETRLLRQEHKIQIEDLLKKHNQEKAGLVASVSECMLEILTSAMMENIDTHKHKFDANGSHDLHIERVAVCNHVALVQFQIRQLLKGRRFKLREIVMHEGSWQSRGTVTTDWPEPGVQSGVAVFLLPDEAPGSASITFRGADTVTISGIDLSNG